MIVNIKKLKPEATMPQYAKPGDAGMDLKAISKTVDEHDNIVYGTGIAMEIPQGYVGLIFPRSSICNHSLSLANCVGVIDSGYRGEISLKFRKLDIPGEEYNVGDKIGQIVIMPYPNIEFNEVHTLSKTERGDNAYGHSGR